MKLSIKVCKSWGHKRSQGLLEKDAAVQTTSSGECLWEKLFANSQAIPCEKHLPCQQQGSSRKDETARMISTLCVNLCIITTHSELPLPFSVFRKTQPNTHLQLTQDTEQKFLCVPHVSLQNFHIKKCTAASFLFPFLFFILWIDLLRKGTHSVQAISGVLPLVDTKFIISEKPHVRLGRNI